MKSTQKTLRNERPDAAVLHYSASSFIPSAEGKRDQRGHRTVIGGDETGELRKKREQGP